MKYFSFFFFFFTQVAMAGLTQGQVPQKLVLEGKTGARVSGDAWSSEEIKGRVFVLFYVDPDEDKMNDHVAKALDAQNFPKEKFHTVAVVNMAATWLPNLAIEAKLKSKQKDYPDVTYVKDFEKVLNKVWGLADDSSDIIAFDQEGKLIFRKDGKLSGSELEELLTSIKTRL